MVIAKDVTIYNLEYQPGQGISAHIDRIHSFQECIWSVSLGSDCVMDFINKNESPERKVAIWFQRCCIMVMTSDARYRWMHTIEAHKTEFYNGHRIERQRRISLTFRNIRLH